MMKQLVFGSLFLIQACVSSEHQQASPKTTKKNNRDTPAAPVSKTSGEKAPAPAATGDIAAAKPACEVYPKLAGGQTPFIKDGPLVITRLSSPCTTEAGEQGFLPHAGWMAMGFPCSAGEGRIDWKGTNYNRPKMVSFILETSCPMAPADREMLRRKGIQGAGLGEKSQVLAFTPFVVQFWEIPGFDDADTGFTVDLRSTRGLDDAWTRFRNGQPLRVFLVGRENAWVSGDNLYSVEADLMWLSKNRFRLDVQSAKQLARSDLDKIKARCEALRPLRECDRVF